MKNRKLNKLLLLSAVFVFFLYVIYFLYQSIGELSKNPIQINKVPPKDFLGLFNFKAKEKLILQSSVSFKLRNPFAIFVYDGKFDIEITKINLIENWQMNNNVILSSIKPSGTYPMSEMPYKELGFTINYNGKSSAPASKIYMALIGDSLKGIENDSLICYKLNLKDAYLQIKRNGIYEIYSEAKTMTFQKKQQVIIALIKRHNSLYFY